MFARLHVLSTTPEQSQRGLELVRDQLLPWLRDSTGYRGLIRFTDETQEKAERYIERSVAETDYGLAWRQVDLEQGQPSRGNPAKMLPTMSRCRRAPKPATASAS